ncbi:MAG: hypothetical protein M3235_03625 [Actinomycetota bacterium]|nr:hypothetical protein [Actinomycetota bacterium]
MSTVGTTARRGAGLLATVLNVIGIVIVVILVLHIVLTLLDANPANGLTAFIAAWAAELNLGLGNLFTPANPKMAVTMNYGVAAIIWLAVTTIVVRLVRRIA